MINKDGITIKQLKELVKELPETDEITGEDFTIWMETGNMLSSPILECLQLNRGDLYFSIKL